MSVFRFSAATRLLFRSLQYQVGRLPAIHPPNPPAIPNKSCTGLSPSILPLADMPTTPNVTTSNMHISTRANHPPQSHR